MSSNEDFELSPSEARAHRLASKAGGSSTQKTLATIVLGFEIFVVFLGGLSMFGLNVFDPPYLGIVFGLSGCLVIVIALGLMRVGQIGMILGWLLHIVYFAAGIALPALYIVAAIFGGLWIFAVIKGGQIDAEKRRRMNVTPESNT